MTGHSLMAQKKKSTERLQSGSLLGPPSNNTETIIISSGPIRNILFQYQYTSFHLTIKS